MAPAFIVGALAGGPAGLVAMGGVAALAGLEFAANQHDGTDAMELADVGRPSEVLLQALDNLEDDPTSAPPTQAAAADAIDAAEVEGGMSIWSDLPAVDPYAGGDGAG